MFRGPLIVACYSAGPGEDRTLKFSEDRDSLDKALALRYTDPVQQSRPENGICIEKVHIRGTASSIPGRRFDGNGD